MSCTALRRKLSTGGAKRSISSIAAGSSVMSDCRRRRWSGYFDSSVMPCAIRLRVVSLPATISNWKKRSSWPLLSCSPSTSALTTRLQTSLPGVTRFSWDFADT